MQICQCGNYGYTAVINTLPAVGSLIANFIWMADDSHQQIGTVCNSSSWHSVDLKTSTILFLPMAEISLHC